MPIDFSDCFPKRPSTSSGPAPTQRRIDPRAALDELDKREAGRHVERQARLEREATNAEQAQLLDQRREARRARDRQLSAAEARASLEAKERRRASSQARILNRRGAEQKAAAHPRRSIKYPFTW